MSCKVCPSAYWSSYLELQKLWPADTFVDFDVGPSTAIQTTERYLGGRQVLRNAVNDNLGIGVT